MAQVKLILREDVQSLGDAGDLVTVKPGYAWNYLLPQGKAVAASAANLSELEHQKRVVTEKLGKERKQLEDVKQGLEALQLAVAARVGEEGRLFGSVTTAQIAALLAERGFEIDRRRILLTEPIKEIGEHVVAIRLQADLNAEVKLSVAAEE